MQNVLDSLVIIIEWECSNYRGFDNASHIKVTESIIVVHMEKVWCGGIYITRNYSLQSLGREEQVFGTNCNITLNKLILAPCSLPCDIIYLLGLEPNHQEINLCKHANNPTPYIFSFFLLQNKLNQRI